MYWLVNGFYVTFISYPFCGNAAKETIIRMAVAKDFISVQWSKSIKKEGKEG
jgi:hypothetical protein